MWKFLASHWPGPAMERGYEEAYQCLLSLQSRGVLLEESASSRHLVLDMMTHYMSRLRLDLTALPPVVHVAGTKGKGSTCAFVESILRGHGLRTGPHAAVAAAPPLPHFAPPGLFTSPHLVHVRERFRLGGAPVNEATFLRYFWRCWDVLEATKVPASQWPPPSPPALTLPPSASPRWARFSRMRPPPSGFLRCPASSAS